MTFQMWRIPAARMSDFSGPAGFTLRHELQHVDEGAPVIAGAWRCGQGGQGGNRISMRRHGVEYFLRRAGADTRQQLHQAKACYAVAGILHEAQHRQHILDMGTVEKLESAEFDEGDVTTYQFDFQWAAVIGGAK